MSIDRIAHLIYTRPAVPLPASDSAIDREPEVVDEEEKRQRKLDRERLIRSETLRNAADPRHNRTADDRRATMPSRCGGRRFDKRRLAYMAEVRRRMA